MSARSSGEARRNGWTTARLLALIAVGAMVLTIARVVEAHPAGVASINRYLGVVLEAEGHLRVAYVLDFAELPAVSELDLLDPDHDDASTPQEQRDYLARRLSPLVSAWSVDVNGVPASPRIASSAVEVQPGERGLSTVRIVAEVAIERPSSAPLHEQTIRVHVREPAFEERAGWRQLVAEDSPAAVVISGPRGLPSEALAYGFGVSTNVPRATEAEFVFRLGGSELARVPAPPPPSRAVVVDPRLAQLSRAMRASSRSWGFTALALLLAIGFGAGHALAPGHGKALAAAYLVGRRARPRHAVLFGATVTVAHTAVVFVMGCLALTVERRVGSDRFLRALELGSAVSVALLGAVQLTRRWRALATTHLDHEHFPTTDPFREGFRAVVALGAAAGLMPCPSALAILFSAIALHRYAFGLLLVLAFSLGVAATLTAVGLVFVLAGSVLDRLPGFRRLVRWVPVLGAALVLGLGVLLCVSAVSP